MSERLERGTIEFDKKQTADVRKIGENALRISEQNYCSGFPDFRGGKIRKLAYHNAYHNRAVGDDAERVAAQAGLSSSEQLLARAAGYTHDIVQLGGRGKDERESAEWIEQELRKKDLPEEVRTMAYKAIWGTLPIFQDGRVVDQTANRQEYGSKREELFAKSVASADLGRLYVPEGPYLGHLYYAQLQGVLPNEAPGMDDFEKFSRNQVVLLNSYKYPLKSAEKVLATHKSQVVRYAEHISKLTNEGKIESWDELMERDRAFIKNPNMKIT